MTNLLSPLYIYDIAIASCLLIIQHAVIFGLECDDDPFGKFGKNLG